MLGKNRSGISNVIPSQLLRYFSPKLTKEFSEENSLGHVPTIFDVLRANGMSYEIKMPATRSEKAVISDIVNRIDERKMPDLAVIHLCSLDLIGHNFGVSSSNVKRAVKSIDKQMYRIIRSIRFSSEKIILIILSDHGMSPVNHTIDLSRILSPLFLKLGKDYLVFLDSTMARFWFFNERARKLICERLSMLKCGRILHKSDLQKLRINNIGREYGELIFALREGYTIFPDFFRKYCPPKGMHGYALPSYDAPILIICASHLPVNFKRKQVVRFVDIIPTMFELLDLPTPPTCQGESLSHEN